MWMFLYSTHPLLNTDFIRFQGSRLARAILDAEDDGADKEEVVEEVVEVVRRFLIDWIWA